jgi:pimeloyl-ACP methyl ester carboxylesterase
MSLVFVHGAGNTGLVWYYQTKYFTDSEAVNLPGHPEGRLCSSIDEYAGRLHEYLRNKGHSQPVIAGHSMGGAITLAYALSYPQGIKALILIDTGARLRVRPDFLKQMEAGVDAPAKWVEDIVKPLYGRVAPEAREKIVDGVAKVGVAAQLNDFRCCDKFDVMDEVERITVPTLVICGSEDDMTPVKYSRYLADKIAGARLVIIEGGSHLCFLENPLEANRAIEEFVNSI